VVSTPSHDRSPRDSRRTVSNPGATPAPAPPPAPPPPKDDGTVPGFGVALPGLTAEEQQRFADGRAAFEEVETPADGLGPVFNNTSCVACHSQGATGGGSETVETRFGTLMHQTFDLLTALGGSLIQTDGIGPAGRCTFVGEKVPAAATIVAGRRTTPLFGLGLVDAVPDATFLALARKQARRHPDVAGRPNMVTDVTTGATVVGKFGWKSQVPNLLQFSGDAYLTRWASPRRCSRTRAARRAIVRSSRTATRSRASTTTWRTSSSSTTS